MANLNSGTSSFPTSLDTSPTLTDGASGDQIVAAHQNGRGTAIVNIETTMGIAKTLGSVLFAGASGNYTEDNANFSYTSPTLTLAQLSLTMMVSDLKFTDATYDIGKSGATRPRDIFTSRNATFGGALVVSGAGPHAIGGATAAFAQVIQYGTFSETG